MNRYSARIHRAKSDKSDISPSAAEPDPLAELACRLLSLYAPLTDAANGKGDFPPDETIEPADGGRIIHMPRAAVQYAAMALQQIVIGRGETVCLAENARDLRVIQAWADARQQEREERQEQQRLEAMTDPNVYPLPYAELIALAQQGLLPEGDVPLRDGATVRQLASRVRYLAERYTRERSQNCIRELALCQLAGNRFRLDQYADPDTQPDITELEPVH